MAIPKQPVLIWNNCLTSGKRFFKISVEVNRIKIVLVAFKIPCHYFDTIIILSKSVRVFPASFFIANEPDSLWPVANALLENGN